MVTVEDFSRLVSGIYAAAVTPQHWEAAIREIHCTVGGIGAALAMADGGVWSILDSTIPVEAAQSYEEYYHRLDHVLATVEKGPVGLVRTGSQLVIPYRNSEFYAGWLRPNGMGDGLLVRLTGGPRPTCFIVTSPERSESFDTPERVKIMGALVPHLQQALRTRNEFAASADSNADLAAALEVVRHGVIIVGSDWWLINLNTAAERILRAEDGLQMRSARIAATGTDAEHKLQRALHAALTDDDSKSRSGRSFLCQRPSGKRPYVVHVLPLNLDSNHETHSGAKALVLIRDPDQEPEPAAALLRHLYGLTTTEADVALRIARGGDLKEISDGLSVSIATVRKHLQHVFDKTDAHRQAELVRLLLTLRP
jgi:DNA-binding CsgD family transcriptional regulator/PAS domain-containing protein